MNGAHGDRRSASGKKASKPTSTSLDAATTANVITPPISKLLKYYIQESCRYEFKKQFDDLISPDVLWSKVAFSLYMSKRAAKRYTEDTKEASSHTGLPLRPDLDTLVNSMIALNLGPFVLPSGKQLAYSAIARTLIRIRRQLLPQSRIEEITAREVPYLIGFNKYVKGIDIDKERASLGDLLGSKFPEDYERGRTTDAIIKQMQDLDKTWAEALRRLKDVINKTYRCSHLA